AKTEPSRACRASALGCGYRITNKSRRASDMTHGSRASRTSQVGEPEGQALIRAWPLLLLRVLPGHAEARSPAQRGGLSLHGRPRDHVDLVRTEIPDRLAVDGRGAEADRAEVRQWKNAPRARGRLGDRFGRRERRTMEALGRRETLAGRGVSDRQREA